MCDVPNETCNLCELDPETVENVKAEESEEKWAFNKRNLGDWAVACYIGPIQYLWVFRPHSDRR